MKLSALILALIASTSFLTGCSKDKDDGKKPAPQIWGQFFAEESQILKVTDLAGNPLADAQILIGTAVGAPFAENFITTDEAGNFIAPEEWTTAEPVTIAAPGFVRATYLAQLPEGQTFKLRTVEPNGRLELSGKGTGFKIKDKDNKIDFALMISALSRHTLFSFNLGMVISPEVDRISVMGQDLDIPSNVALPKQKESYVLPITIEKSQYRMYFNKPGTKRVYTAHGTFPFKETVKEMRENKPFNELVNFFTLHGGSIKDIKVVNPKQTQDLPVNELVFNQKRAFKTPAFANDEFLLALPMSEYQSDFYPTDVKNVEAQKTVNLTIAAGSTPHLLTVLKKKNEDALGAGRLSATLIPFDANVEPRILPLIGKPTVVSPYEVVLPAIPSVATIQPVATMSILSKLEVKTINGLKVEVLTPLWEVYAKTWTSGFKLPEWPHETNPQGQRRWEVSFVGSQNAQTVDLGPGMLDTATHATRSSSDF